MENAIQIELVKDLFEKGKFQDCLGHLIPKVQKTSRDYRIIGACYLKMEQWNGAAWAFHDSIQKGKHLSSYIGYIISINKIIGRETIGKINLGVNPFSYDYLVNKSRDPKLFIEISELFEKKGFVEEAFEFAQPASDIKHNSDSALEIRCLGLRNQLPNYKDHVILPEFPNEKPFICSLSPVITDDRYAGRCDRIINQYERGAYSALKELFPRYTVLTNLPLLQLFEPSIARFAKPFRDENFYFHSHIDFCLVNDHYMPVIGIEMDSEYHDNDIQYLRDMAKNRIFKKGGIPLIRIRYFKDDYTSANFRQYLVYQIFLANVRLDFL